MKNYQSLTTVIVELSLVTLTLPKSGIQSQNVTLLGISLVFRSPTTTTLQFKGLSSTTINKMAYICIMGMVSHYTIHVCLQMDEMGFEGFYRLIERYLRIILSVRMGVRV